MASRFWIVRHDQSADNVTHDAARAVNGLISKPRHVDVPLGEQQSRAYE
jgi:hypothetical protein